MTVGTLTRLAGDLAQIKDGHLPDSDWTVVPSMAVREWAKRWLIELVLLGVDPPPDLERP